MSWATTMLPLPVLVPLGAAALLLALAHWMPARVGDVVGVLVSAFVAVLCAWLARESVGGAVLHWFGGWTPAVSERPDVTLGIAFSADPASAGIAAFCGLLFLAAFLFAWSYFDEVQSHFHVLMLLFLAALVGFCLTRDLFNLFVWFELMSVAAYALTAYPLGPSSLEGAFNFTVVNSLASFLMLAGVGLLYARTGALDYELIGRGVASAGADPVVLGGFCLVAVALLTKGACVPFHFWLADAHSVAPSPVSVIFSGAMVSVALFGLAKLVAILFAGDMAIMAFVHGVLPWLGAVTAVVGALSAWSQRHLKRLLAFSTIAHLGIMLTAVGAAPGIGRAGLLLYLIGHGLVKGGLFMIAGILLALRASADEIDLYGKARRLWPVGLTMATAGLLLGGLPVGLLHGGARLVEAASGGDPVVLAAGRLATALTGAAVLRAALRIFAGVSGTPGPERDGATEREHEKNDRPPWLMLAPCTGLVLLALLPASWGEGVAAIGATGLSGRLVRMPASEGWLSELLPIALTGLVLAFSLVRRRPVSPIARIVAEVESRPLGLLHRVHSGLIGDYAAWLALGLAMLAATLG